MGLLQFRGFDPLQEAHMLLVWPVKHPLISAYAGRRSSNALSGPSECYARQEAGDTQSLTRYYLFYPHFLLAEVNISNSFIFILDHSL